MDGITCMLCYHAQANKQARLGPARRGIELDLDLRSIHVLALRFLFSGELFGLNDGLMD